MSDPKFLDPHASQSGTDPSSFEDEWPKLKREIDRVLCNRGVRAERREDLLQETGLRLYRRWGSIDRSKPVFGLAVTIALNLMRDEFRRARFEVMSELPDGPSSVDVERTSLARLEFGGVARALTQLSDDHRGVLLQDLSGAPASTDRSPDAIKMLRFRARRRLTAILQTASVCVLWISSKLTRTNEGQSISSTAAAAFALVAVFGPVQPVIPEKVDPGPGRPVIANIRPDDPARSTAEQARSTDRRGTVPATLSAKPASGSQTADDGEPVRVEAGGSSVSAQGTVEAEGIRIEVKDTGGPVPVCVDGPLGPSPVGCPEEQG